MMKNHLSNRHGTDRVHILLKSVVYVDLSGYKTPHG